MFFVFCCCCLVFVLFCFWLLQVRQDGMRICTWGRKTTSLMPPARGGKWQRFSTFPCGFKGPRDWRGLILVFGTVQRKGNPSHICIPAFLRIPRVPGVAGSEHSEGLGKPPVGWRWGFSTPSGPPPEPMFPPGCFPRAEFPLYKGLSPPR